MADNTQNQVVQSGEKIVRFQLVNSSYRNLFFKVRFGTKGNPNPDEDDIGFVDRFYEMFKQKYSESYLSPTSDGKKGILEIKIPLNIKSQDPNVSQGLPQMAEIEGMYLPKISSIAEKYGYEVSTDNVDYIKSQIARYEKGLQDRIAARQKGGDLSILRSEAFRRFKEQLMKGDIQALKDQITIAPLDATTAGDISAIKALKSGMFSADNIALAIMTWQEAGRAGTPSFLLTEIQWANIYNRGINPDALEIRLVNPNEMGGYDASQAEQMTGMNARQASKLGKAVHKGFVKAAMPFKAQSSFHMYSYYDESDTFPLQSGVDEFASDNVMGNINGELNDTAKQNLLPKDTTIDIKSKVDVDTAMNDIQNAMKGQFTSSNINGVYLKKAFAELEKEQPQIYKGISRADLKNGLEKYFSNIDYIDRDRNNSSKVQKIRFAMILAVAVLKLDGNLLKNLIASQGQSALDVNNPGYDEALPAVVQLVADVERVNDTIVENTQTILQKQNIREGFANIWNKMVDIKYRDKRDLYD